MGLRRKIFETILRLLPYSVRDFLKYMYQINKSHAKGQKIEIKNLDSEINILTPLFLDFNGDKFMRGGAERYLIELIKIIEEMGYKNRVLVFQDSFYEWSRFYKNIKIIGLGMGGVERYLNKKFHKVVPERKLTIYHAFYLAHPYSHKNSIGISHGIFWDNPEFQKSSIFLKDKIKTVIYSIKNCNTVVSVDTNLINWLRTINYKLTSKIVYIPNFVDIKKFRPSDIRHNNEIIILYPRRLYNPRGFWITTEVVPKILKEFSNVKFLFVGEIDSGEEYNELKKLRESFGEKVDWLSSDPEEMNMIYQMSDIVLIPSLYAEGTSLSLLEAFASGKAVVCSNVGGLTNIAIDNFNSLVISPDSYELYISTKKLIMDSELRKRLSMNALETARAFDIKIWRNRWKSLLRKYL